MCVLNASCFIVIQIYMVGLWNVSMFVLMLEYKVGYLPLLFIWFRLTVSFEISSNMWIVGFKWIKVGVNLCCKIKINSRYVLIDFAEPSFGKLRQQSCGKNTPRGWRLNSAGSFLLGLPIFLAVLWQCPS